MTSLWPNTALDEAIGSRHLVSSTGGRRHLTARVGCAAGLLVHFCMARPSGGLMFRLGQFVGGIARGVTAPISGPIDKPRSKVVSRQVEQETRDEGEQVVTLRRTTIEEVEVRPSAPGGRP